jgi:hypothetical protein
MSIGLEVENVDVIEHGVIKGSPANISMVGIGNSICSTMHQITSEDHRLHAFAPSRTPDASATDASHLGTFGPLRPRSVGLRKSTLNSLGERKGSAGPLIASYAHRAVTRSAKDLNSCNQQNKRLPAVSRACSRYASLRIKGVTCRLRTPLRPLEARPRLHFDISTRTRAAGLA